MNVLILSLGMVLVVEGLVFALAPKRIEEALKLMASLKPEVRRMTGLITVAIGVLLVWIAKILS
jgi:uncharacterized protein YjeT (DUF2065 family)